MTSRRLSSDGRRAVVVTEALDQVDHAAVGLDRGTRVENAVARIDPDDVRHERVDRQVALRRQETKARHLQHSPGWDPRDPSGVDSTSRGGSGTSRRTGAHIQRLEAGRRHSPLVDQAFNVAFIPHRNGAWRPSWRKLLQIGGFVGAESEAFAPPEAQAFIEHVFEGHARHARMLLEYPDEDAR